MTHATLLLFLGLIQAGQAVEVERILTVGAREGTGPAVFGRVADVELDENGRIFVLDGLAAEVRIFGPDGRHVGTFGRRGEGPGELRSPLAIDGAGGTVVVTQLGKAAQFTPSGEFLASHRVPVAGVARVLPLREGHLLGLREGVVRTSGVDNRQVVGLSWEGQWSEILAAPSSGLFYRGGDLAMALGSPLCPSLHIAPLEDGAFLAAHGGGGRLVQDRVRGARADQVVFPPFASGICGLEVESDQRVWVRVPSEDDRQVWQAFHVESGRKGVVLTLPAGEKATAFRNGRIATVRRDELDVDFVSVFRLPPYP